MGGFPSRKKAVAPAAGGSKKVMPQKECTPGGISKSKFITENSGKVTDFYQAEKKKLGEGSYGSVVKAKSKSTQAQRAIKTISKQQMKNLERFQQEIAIMKMMDHPNIIKLYETFEDHKNIYLVMELCNGGELFDRIIEAGHFTESDCAIIMTQIIRAIYYMHENFVCHRDLKPENFLFMTKDKISKNHLKIIDFGLSCQFKHGDVLTTKAGTPYYVAPQVLNGKYDHLSDMWSIGVIMFVMLCGYPPFFGESDAEVLSKVRLGTFTFHPTDWKNISEDAKQLIRYLLKMNPRDRYTAEQALNHRWIKEKAPDGTSVSLADNFVDNLRSFRSQNKLKKAALHIIANQLNEDQIKALRQTFSALDNNGDGQLTAAEMKEGLSKAGLNDIPDDMQQILQDIDTDGSGVIDYTEFLAATLDKRMYLQENVCWEAFGKFDKDGNGQISLDELKEVLGDEQVQGMVGHQSAEELMAQIDHDKSGSINFEEFMQMMRA
jgi:calcium-dependent protein kinase